MRPEAFYIRLLPTGDRGPDGEQVGEIRIGTFVERFAVHPLDDTVEALATRWSDELRRLLGGAPAVGLPIASNVAWVLYRSGREVLVQQMLMLPGVGPKLEPGGQVIDIPAHATVSEDGGPLSQWSTTIEAIAAFVAT